MVPLLLTLLICTATALEVGPLHISGNREYITYGLGPSEDLSRLVCTFSQEENQEVSSVKWEIEKDGEAVGFFEWKPMATGTASGLLENKVNLTRADSDMELITLTYELSANYTCTVTATDGTSGRATDEILIVDTTNRMINQSYDDDEDRCIVEMGVSFFPMFPEPTVYAGLYVQESDEYYETITNWETVHHANGTVEYSAPKQVFQIDENTPDDAIVSSVIGVSKTNGQYFSIYRVTISFGFQRSCKDLEVGEHQTVIFNNDSCTCYGEPYSTSERLNATVDCAEGYGSDGEVTSVTMYCERVNGTYQWVPAIEDLLPEDLRCGSGVIAANPTNCFVSLVSTLIIYFYKQ